MATHPIVVVDQGKVQIPEELRDDPCFRDGAKLQLVPVSTGSAASPPEQVKSTSQAWEDFMSLGGLLAHSSYDPNAELEKEKQRELEEEARWARD